MPKIKHRLFPFTVAINACFLLFARAAHAYIDPGTQTMVIQVFGIALSALATFAGLMLLRFKAIIHWFRRIFLRRRVIFGMVILGITAALGGGVMTAVGPGTKQKGEPILKNVNTAVSEKVIVLGMDGLDPKIITAMIESGDLPNFKHLRTAGTLSALQTTLPPETPVAWSAIATGCNPGKFGIYDFLHRDPQTYSPILAIYQVNPSNFLDKKEKRYLPVRKAPGFWTIASQADVPVTVLRWPAAFPPEPVTGHFLSGLGIPDLSGRLGRYYLFTTLAEPVENKAFKGRWRYAPWNKDLFTSTLKGPTVAGLSGRKEAELDVIIRRRNERQISLCIGDGTEMTLNVGQWSDYIPIRFRPGWGQNAPGMVRAYLVALEPHLKLYVSTPELDPADPYFPFTYPNEYAKNLAVAIGRYTTLGMPEDVNAMKDGTLSPKAFEQAMLNLFDERKKQFNYEFQRFQKGLFVFVFDAGDRIQHMFWRTRDKDHPNYDAAFAKAFGHVIPDMYKRMDCVLGEVLAATDEHTTVIVVSDHGFNTFRRRVGLNSWLVENGYMKLTTPDGRNGRVLFADVDWSETKAYSVGFCGLYINLKGREKQGVVEPGQAYHKLCDELITRIRQIKDPVSDAFAIRNVYLGTEAYHGDLTAHAPDLVVGFNAGFRAEDRNVIGAAPAKVFADNLSLWSGDHLTDPHVVPGIFASNRKLQRKHPRAVDVAATILRCLGIDRPDNMGGNPLL